MPVTGCLRHAGSGLVAFVLSMHPSEPELQRVTLKSLIVLSGIRTGDRTRGRQTFGEYVEQEWWPNARLEEPTLRLLVETDIESGLRRGELTELRPKDLGLAVGMIAVSRAVVELRAKNRPDDQRFVVKRYPKDEEHRQVKVAGHLVDKLRVHRRARARSG
jgi:integrase